jgi:hypothetical protein
LKLFFSKISFSIKLLACQVELDAARHVEPNLHLIGHSGGYNASSYDECFDKCDADPKCAAACFTVTISRKVGETRPLCFSYKFGFNQKVSTVMAWTAYIKPEVNKELANTDMLKKEFPKVTRRRKLLNHYDAFDTLTPSQCFRTCKLSFKCGAASFTADLVWTYNCFLFRHGEFKVSSFSDFKFK